jgi:hypothetical protein
MLDLEIALPEQALVDLICDHQGSITEAHLRAAGYASEYIRQLCQQEQLIEVAPAQYRLFDELTFFDPLVVIQWAIPEGVIAGRTALNEHRLTVSLPKEVDICVPPGWVARLIPPGFQVHSVVLSSELRTYGVMRLIPERPGTVPIAIYVPAVAVVQTFADPYYDTETRYDAVWMYRQLIGDEGALQEAAQRYHVELPSTVYAAVR